MPGRESVLGDPAAAAATAPQEVEQDVTENVAAAGLPQSASTLPLSVYTERNQSDTEDSLFEVSFVLLILCTTYVLLCNIGTYVQYVNAFFSVRGLCK